MAKRNKLKSVTWITIGAITILIWVGILNLVWPWLGS